MSEGGKRDPNSAGKGDTPRPVDTSKYRKNYDEIDWSKTKAPVIKSKEDALERYHALKTR